MMGSLLWQARSRKADTRKFVDALLLILSSKVARSRDPRSVEANYPIAKYRPHYSIRASKSIILISTLAKSIA
jgi:hypothetical protein